MAKKWIDISVGLQNGLVHWPSDPGFDIRRVKSLENGDPANLSVVSAGVHSGTHMDAPIHFLKNGKGIEAVLIEKMIGPARVIEIKDTESIGITELKKNKIKKGERILFKTINSRINWAYKKFNKNFVYISPDAAKYLVDVEVSLVGVDYLSVGGYKTDGAETHKILLHSDIVIIEGLVLNKIKPGKYDLICLPLKIIGSDGAPARAVIKPVK